MRKQPRDVEVRRAASRVLTTMVRQLVVGMAAGLMVASCTQPVASAAPSATGPTEAASADAVPLAINGSGDFCGPWWFGCGAYLLIEAPGWTFSRDWVPTEADTRFFVVSDISEKEPTKVTGVMHLGQEAIEPGAYRLVVIETHTSDTSSNGQPPPVDVFFLCANDATIEPGTRLVSIDVRFLPGGCTIAIS